MSNIQERINSLRPNVISFRFGSNGMPIIDAVFKKGWKIPQIQGIEASLAEEKNNYYMIFAKENHIGIDELLDFVQYVKEYNRERELKHVLYQTKLAELKDLFKNESLTTLETLQFITNIPKIEEDESSYDETDDEELDLDSEAPAVKATAAKPAQKPAQKPAAPQVQMIPADEPPEATMAENEVIIPAEKIAEISERNNSAPVIHQTEKVAGNSINLPPKPNKKPRVEVQEFKVQATGECNCGPEDACPICIDSK